MSRLDFSNKRYLEILKSLEDTLGNGDKCEFSSVEAFLYLIKGLPKEDLDNLCEHLQNYFGTQYGLTDLSLDDIYEIIQGNGDKKMQLYDKTKKEILEQAYKVIDCGKSLGNKTIANGKINTSSWLSHSLYVGRFSGVIANELNNKQNRKLDVESVKALAILHDCGRKKDHTLGHVTIGAEALINEGYPYASRAAVIHSFFAGERCAINDKAEVGFHMGERGEACWSDDAEKDDIREYLEIHKLTITDLILNLGDLTATDKGVVTVYDRLKDIATRRELDPTNREFFLLKLINGMTYILSEMQVEIPKEIISNIPKPGAGIEFAEESIRQLSEVLYQHYNKLVENKRTAPSNKDKVDVEK